MSDNCAITVVQLNMMMKSPGLAKASTADWTSERPIARMRVSMSSQIARSWKRPPTGVALVGFFLNRELHKKKLTLSNR